MDGTPDFEALRAHRNAEVQKLLEQAAADFGVPLHSVRTSFKPDACYCACSTGGPCEHNWNGPGWTSEDGRGWSATCSRCGCTAMSHDVGFFD